MHSQTNQHAGLKISVSLINIAIITDMTKISSSKFGEGFDDNWVQNV